MESTVFPRRKTEEWLFHPHAIIHIEVTAQIDPEINCFYGEEGFNDYFCLPYQPHTLPPHLKEKQWRRIGSLILNICAYKTFLRTHIFVPLKKVFCLQKRFIFLRNQEQSGLGNCNGNATNKKPYILTKSNAYSAIFSPGFPLSSRKYSVTFLVDNIKGTR